MTVWNTVANMRVLDASIVSFFRALEEQISDQALWQLVDPEEAASSSSPNGWCRNAWYGLYPLRRVPRGEGRNRGPANLTVGVELWREVPSQENAWQYAREPLIYVGYCPARNDWWHEDMACDYQGIPVHYPSGEVMAPTKGTPYLWTLNGEDVDARWSLRNWYFILKLFSTHSRDEIRNEIIDPLKSLIGDNASRDVAFQRSSVIQTGPQDQ